MQHKSWYRLLIFVMLLLYGAASAQVKQESRTLVVNGQTGEAVVVQIDGRTFVDLESLARVGNGSVGFRGNQINLTLPSSVTSTPVAAIEPGRQTPPGISRNFRMAGIETVAQMREWASTLAYAIQNGYGVTEDWVAGYREKAAQSLNLATAAASTGPDRDALQLLTTEFEAVLLWSNNLVKAKKSMDTGNMLFPPASCETSLYPRRSSPAGDSWSPCWEAGNLKTIRHATDSRLIGSS